MIENRPWGFYEILIDNPKYKVKRISVNSGKRLSYQYHLERDENWAIVEGS
jgi:mannose-6-phosphate isomerase